MLSNLSISNGKLSITLKDLELKNSLFFTLTSESNFEETIREELVRVENDISLIEATLIAIENIDDVILIVRKAKNPTEALKKLCAKYKYSKEQSVFVLDLELTEIDFEIFSRKKNNLIKYKMFLINLLNEEKHE